MVQLKFAMVCSSNQNRSMEAHALLQSHGLKVASYGTGQKVRLPGESADAPNVYDFGTPYSIMLDDLRSKSESYYQKKGLLRMLDRNAQIKIAPERWQTTKERFNIALTFEQRVMDHLLDDMLSRGESGVPLLVINLDVVDNHEEAATAAPLVLKLCQKLEEGNSLWDKVEHALEVFQTELGKPLVYSVCFY